jgi:hypothetical protein
MNGWGSVTTISAAPTGLCSGALAALGESSQIDAIAGAASLLFTWSYESFKAEYLKAQPCSKPSLLSTVADSGPPRLVTAFAVCSAWLG